MSGQQQHEDALVLGGPLLTVAEAVQVSGLSADILHNNPTRRCKPIIIGKQFYFFEDDVEALVKFLTHTNPEAKGDHRHGK